MEKLHTITGLPRAGTTLLCNILNQNPNIYASDTSFVAEMISNIQMTASNSIVFKAEYDNDKLGTESKLWNVYNGIITGWYSDRKEEIIFDKSRGWVHLQLLLSQLYPQSKSICMVRDLREVYASVEKQHRNTALVDNVTDFTQKGVFNRASTLFAQDNLIGAPILGIMDAVMRKLPNILFIRYEDLVSSPKDIMQQIYEFIGQPMFEHDFDNVINQANDPDGFYLHKFPHEGSGKVRPSSSHWSEYYDIELAKTIMNKFADFNEFFHYY